MTKNMISVLLDAALRAAQLAPLLFAQPAAAQLPRPLNPPAAQAGGATTTVVLDPASTPAPLQLVASHLDVQVNGKLAMVRTTLTYRNAGALPVEALYTVPLPALLATADQRVIALGAPVMEDAGCGDEPYEVAQFAEAGEAPEVRYEQGTVLVAPGEEVTLTLARPTELVVRDARYRLVLPLGFQRGASFTPRFSADVSVAAEQPIRALTSATHGGEVENLGGTHARLSIPEGRAYEGQFLAFDFELGEGEADTPVRNVAAWGGEGRGLVRASFIPAAR